MSIATAIVALETQRDNLAANLVLKGVNAAKTETLSSLVPKVLGIKTGGSSGIMSCLINARATGTASPFAYLQSNISTSQI